MDKKLVSYSLWVKFSSLSVFINKSFIGKYPFQLAYKEYIGASTQHKS